MIFHLPNFKHTATGGVVVSGSEVNISGKSEVERRHYTRYPAHVKEKAVELGREGISHRHIGRQLGVPYSTISMWLFDLGCGVRSLPRRFTPEVVERIRELAGRGFSQGEIAADIGGTSQSSISKVMRMHKIKPGVRKLLPVKTWASVSVEIK